MIKIVSWILWEIVWKLKQLPNLKLILNQFRGISNEKGRERRKPFGKTNWVLE